MLCVTIKFSPLLNILKQIKTVMNHFKTLESFAAEAEEYARSFKNSISFENKIVDMTKTDEERASILEKIIGIYSGSDASKQQIEEIYNSLTCKTYTLKIGDAEVIGMDYNGIDDKMDLQSFTGFYFRECGDCLCGRSARGDLTVRAGDTIVKYKDDVYVVNRDFCKN